jgi:putative Mg2+ transporter-C (MgtC) family protein
MQILRIFTSGTVLGIDDILINWLNGFFPPFGNFLLILLSILVAVILTAMIGYEREYHGHSAGLRTHILVGLASALVMVVSIYGFGDINDARDPARLAAQVVSGIGFLGAGTIIQTGTDIKGLTTATTLWLVMAIGLASGAGQFLIATFTTVIALLALTALRKVEKMANNRAPKIIMLVPTDMPILKHVHTTTMHLGVSIKDISSQIINFQGTQVLRVVLSINYMSKATSVALIEELKSIIKPIEIKVTNEN